MKILIIGDCHGKLTEIDNEEVDKADFILATGDICGDSEQIRSKMFEASEKDEKWYELMDRDEAEKFVEKSIEQGRNVLEKLNSLGKPVFLVPGNWDWYEKEELDVASERYEDIVSEFENIHDINFEITEIEGYSIIGYGPCSGPEIPQHEDDEPETEEELEEMNREYREYKQELESLFEKAESPIIFLSHNFPHGTELDKVDNPDSPVHGRHFGSVVVKELVEEFSPILSVAGHMHEGYGSIELGETVCVNAGLNSTVLVEVKDQVKGSEFKPET